ncbi:MAG TPA: hypothetical protein VGR47_04950 [Terracidiphilus sp.]|nr:hypothetical protein [Terracidiphilus sp.]
MRNKGKRRRSANPMRSLLDVLKRIFRRKPEPEDPYAYRMAPLRRPPHGRSGAAVAELDED